MTKIQQVPRPVTSGLVQKVSRVVAAVIGGQRAVLYDFDQARIPVPRMAFTVLAAGETVTAAMLELAVREGVQVGKRVLSVNILNEDTVIDDVCLSGTDEEIQAASVAIAQFYEAERDWVVRATLRHAYWSVEKQNAIRVQEISA